MEFDESSTDYGNAIRIFPDMMPTDYEKGCISFAHLRTYFDHTKARLELLCPIAILENKAYTIDFGSAILWNLYYCLDQASKQEVKYIGGLFQLIEEIVVDWEDDEGEMGTSQAGTLRGRGSWGRGSRGRTYEGGADPPRRSRRARGRTFFV
ncbi:hypothetical protein GIB67_023491 [Kingdonia uniflora]|uniref:Uncharacterized protein n=1 Tax=Kingdonia uniflora TaxID=39325 RepID=A0A7J7PA33_9MAGN|nr:hypothetical protein GIB67_023491 [Kingdonia uniflora]